MLPVKTESMNRTELENNLIFQFLLNKITVISGWIRSWDWGERIERRRIGQDLALATFLGGKVKQFQKYVTPSIQNKVGSTIIHTAHSVNHLGIGVISEQIIRIDHLNIKMAEPAFTVVKAVLLGNMSVSKTCLLRREAENEFTQGFPISIGIDFKIKTYQIGDVAVKGQLWDSGHGNGEKFSNASHNLYRNAQAIGFCFALNNKESFQDLDKLIKEVEGNTEAKLFLIGCKGDQMPEMVDEQVMNYAEKHQLTYFRTSSLQNWGVNELFMEMIKQGLPVKLAQLSKQAANVVPLTPPCKQKCEVM